MQLINLFICAIVKHELLEAGICPFTNKEYLMCKRCTKMFEKTKLN
jgi:hypothetical protein